MSPKRANSVNAAASSLLRKKQVNERKEDETKNIDMMEDDEAMFKWALKTLQRTQYLSDSDCGMEDSSSDSEASDDDRSRTQVSQTSTRNRGSTKARQNQQAAGGAASESTSMLLSAVKTEPSDTEFTSTSVAINRPAQISLAVPIKTEPSDSHNGDDEAEQKVHSSVESCHPERQAPNQKVPHSLTKSNINGETSWRYQRKESTSKEGASFPRIKEEPQDVGLDNMPAEKSVVVPMDIDNDALPWRGELITPTALTLQLPYTQRQRARMVPSQCSVENASAIRNVPAVNTISVAGNNRLDTDRRRNLSPTMNVSNHAAERCARGPPGSGADSVIRYVPSPATDLSQPAAADVTGTLRNVTDSKSRGISALPAAAEKTPTLSSSLACDVDNIHEVMATSTTNTITASLPHAVTRVRIEEDSSCNLKGTSRIASSQGKSGCSFQRNSSIVVGKTPTHSISFSNTERRHTGTKGSEHLPVANFDSNENSNEAKKDVSAVNPISKPSCDDQTDTEVMLAGCESRCSLPQDHFVVEKTLAVTGGSSRCSGNPTSLVIFNNRVPIVVLEDCMKISRPLQELNDCNRKRRHFSKRIYFCDVCNKQFKCQTALVVHRDEKHLNEQTSDAKDDEDFDVEDVYCSDYPSEEEQKEDDDDEEESDRQLYSLRVKARKTSYPATVDNDSDDSSNSSDSMRRVKRRRRFTIRPVKRKINLFESDSQDETAENNLDDKSKESLDSCEDVQYFRCYLCQKSTDNMESLDHHLKICSQSFLEGRNPPSGDNCERLDNGTPLSAPCNTASTGNPTTESANSSSNPVCTETNRRLCVPVSEDQPIGQVNSILPGTLHNVPSDVGMCVTPTPDLSNVTSAKPKISQSVVYNTKRSISAPIGGSVPSAMSRTLQNNDSTASVINSSSDNIVSRALNKFSESTQRLSPHGNSNARFSNRVSIANELSHDKISSDNITCTQQKDSMPTVSPHGVPYTTPSLSKPVQRVSPHGNPNAGFSNRVSIANEPSHDKTSSDNITCMKQKDSMPTVSPHAVPYTTPSVSGSVQRVSPHGNPNAGFSNRVSITSEPSHDKTSSNNITCKKQEDSMPTMSPHGIPYTTPSVSVCVNNVLNPGVVRDTLDKEDLFRMSKKISECMKSVPPTGLSNNVTSESSLVKTSHTTYIKPRKISELMPKEPPHCVPYNRQSVIIPVTNSPSHVADSDTSSNEVFRTSKDTSDSMQMVVEDSRTRTLYPPPLRTSTTVVDNTSKISPNGPHPKNLEVVTSATDAGRGNQRFVLMRNVLPHGVTFARTSVSHPITINGENVPKVPQPLILKMPSHDSTSSKTIQPMILVRTGPKRIEKNGNPLPLDSHTTTVVQNLTCGSSAEQVALTSSGGSPLTPATSSVSTFVVPITTKWPPASVSGSVQNAGMHLINQNTISIPPFTLQPCSSAERPITYSNKDRTSFTGDSKSREVASTHPKSVMTLSGNGYSMRLPIVSVLNAVNQQQSSTCDQTARSQLTMQNTASSQNTLAVQSPVTYYLNPAVPKCTDTSSQRNVPETSTSATAGLKKCYFRTILPVKSPLVQLSPPIADSHLLGKTWKAANSHPNVPTTYVGNSSPIVLQNASVPVVQQQLPIGNQSSDTTNKPQTTKNNASKMVFYVLNKKMYKTTALGTDNLKSAAENSEKDTEIRTAGGDENYTSAPRKPSSAGYRKIAQCYKCKEWLHCVGDCFQHMRRHFHVAEGRQYPVSSTPSYYPSGPSLTNSDRVEACHWNFVCPVCLLPLDKKGPFLNHLDKHVNPLASE